MALKMTFNPTPEQSDDDVYVSGTEPWDLNTLFKETGNEGLLASPAGPMLACADTLRTGGPSALTKEQRAFWLSYQTDAKSPLPPVSVPSIDLEEVHIKNAISAFTAAKTEVSDLDTAMDQTEHSLVCRHNVVGVFAKRGPIRLLALPDWCRFAVCVNTKARYWEVIACGHHPLISLTLLMAAAVKGEWSGHRYRVRQTGLPDMRNLHLAMNSLAVNAERLT